MNKVLKLSLIGIGAAIGFGGAFVAFSRMLGAGWHEIAVVGGLFPEPAPEEQGEHEAEPGHAQPHAAAAAPEQHVTPAGIGVLDIFQLESPFSANELEELTALLEDKLAEVEQRLQEVAVREQSAEDRSAFLDEQYATLNKLRTGLETWENELRQREVEVERDEAARAAREAESWTRLAKLFEKGDAGEQSQRLLSYTPDDAASILLRLKPTRAQELLDELEGDAWKTYAEAYRVREAE